jgi:hypothetical protein
MTVTCPNCHTYGAETFYQVRQVPVHSVLQLESRAEALAYPRGDIDLAHCPACGFVFNAIFDADVHEYSARYESTQRFSRMFSAFATQQARELVDRWGIRGKTVIEIGCGQGEFLTQVCELGENRGLGFDPAYRAEPLDSPAADRIQFIADFYGEAYAHHRADAVICKMTLEHIDRTYEFMQTVRRSVTSPDTLVFFQVPNGRYVLDDLAFWDVYYEHCSYFTLGSLARLFRQTHFEVLALETIYDNQYITIVAKPAPAATVAALPEENDLDAIAASVAHFRQNAPARIAHWRDMLRGLHAAGQRVVLWGGGSKGVTFLNACGLADAVEYVVDVNPNKAGMFMAGTGQQIVSPAFLTDYRPDAVVVMNPIYCDEIAQDLAALGLQPALMKV